MPDKTTKYQDLAELDARIPRNMMMEYQGKPYVLKSGLEWKASQLFGLGKWSLTTTIEERTDDRIVVKAVLELEGGIQYSNFGEANRFNTNRMMFANALHLATTRAECRVLRMATASGVAYEEMEGSAESPRQVPVTDDDEKTPTELQIQVLRANGVNEIPKTQREAKEKIAAFTGKKA